MIVLNDGCSVDVHVQPTFRKSTIMAIAIVDCHLRTLSSTIIFLKFEYKLRFATSYIN